MRSSAPVRPLDPVIASWYYPSTIVAIFVNYRRHDSESITGRIDDHLRAAFGDSDVYRDIDSIPPGVDFVEHLASSLNHCDLCIAVLGPRWPSERLNEESDLVRIELETVLARGIPLIPVLVEGARLPDPAQIPPTLFPLLRRQAMQVDSGADFRVHVQRLVQAIKLVREGNAKRQSEAQPAAIEAARVPAIEDERSLGTRNPSERSNRLGVGEAGDSSAQAELRRYELENARLRAALDVEVATAVVPQKRTIHVVFFVFFVLALVPLFLLLLSFLIR